jgi:hypothetical protein
LKCYDFARQRLIYYNTRNTLRSVDEDGNKKTHEIPLKPGYEISNFKITSAGLFIKASKTKEGIEEYIIYRFSLDSNEVEECYHSEGRIYFQYYSDKKICLIESQDTNGLLNFRLSVIDLLTKNCSHNALKKVGSLFFMNEDSVFQLAKDEKILHQINLNPLHEIKEYDITSVDGYGIYGLCGTREYALLRMQNRSTGMMALLLINLSNGISKTVEIDGLYNQIFMMKFKNHTYTILTE